MKSPTFWAQKKGDFIHNTCLMIKKYYAEIKEVKADPSGAWVSGFSLAGIVGSNSEHCVLSRSLCVRLNTCPEESY